MANFSAKKNVFSNLTRKKLERETNNLESEKRSVCKLQNIATKVKVKRLKEMKMGKIKKTGLGESLTKKPNQSFIRK